MNLRHAAALALVGWYLMTPPPLVPPRGEVLVDALAPLSNWRVFHAYDSAKQCEQQHSAMFDEAKGHQNSTDASERAVFQMAMSAQCIATDDPRLKEK